MENGESLPFWLLVGAPESRTMSPVCPLMPFLFLNYCLQFNNILIKLTFRFSSPNKLFIHDGILDGAFLSLCFTQFFLLPNLGLDQKLC